MTYRLNGEKGEIMAIYENGIETYAGAVLKEESHFWLDGMEDVYAVVWDADAGEVKRIQVGYFGADCRNMMDTVWKIDATPEVKRAVRKWLKVAARAEFAKSVIAYKNEVRKGSHVEVVRGRKVKKGTQLKVFWVGEKETYRGRQYHWMHETETIAGCYDPNGKKVWIKAEYLKVTDDIKSPNAKERRKFIKNYVNNMAINYGA